MAHRTITPLPNGLVAVYTHIEGVAAVEERQYKRRGQLVYMLRDSGPPLPMCRGLSTNGKPLFVKPGETLAEVITRELEPVKPRPAWVRWVVGWAQRIVYG